ncbi:MAG: hypothetical protein EA398_09600 [Deltaproteobacteria bacterium]|nr:MAG: hypothetical protein EA398_09600 [Deltaproteobacteria bacterium]
MSPVELNSLRWIYFTYLGSVGIMATFFPVHFASLGFTAFQIGLLFAVRTAISIVGQPWITAAADRSGRPLRWLRVSLFGALLIAAGLPWASTFVLVAALLWLQTPLQTSTIPLLDARLVTAGGHTVWSGVRLWGSIGYGLCVGAFGLWMAQATDESVIGQRAVQAYLLLALLGCLAALPLRDRAVEGLRSPPRSLGMLLKLPGLPRFFAAHAMHWAAVMIFNVFIALHVAARGESALVTGTAVALAIVGEVVAFRWASRLLPPGTAAGWMPAVFAVSAVRWLVTAWAPSAAWLIGVQALHFLSFGVWFAAAMIQLGERVEAHERASLQGLFMAATFGVGGMLGTLAGGAVADGPGGLPAAFFLAAILEAIALLLLVPDMVRRLRDRLR